MNFYEIFLNKIEWINLFFSISSLLIFSHFFGRIFNMLYLPRVIGEIFSGILLGPSILGFISKKYYLILFNNFPEQEKILTSLYWIGLTLLMLCAGFKIKNSGDSNDTKLIINLLISSTCLPILGGIFYYFFYDFAQYKGSLGTNLSLAIIICISIAITSIPIISKIFIDLDIIHTRFAKIVLITATFHDLLLWVALDVAMKDSKMENNNIFSNTVIVIMFLLFSFIAGNFLKSFGVYFKNFKFLKFNSFLYLLSVCFIVISVSHYLKINIIFGSLMAGIIVGNFPDKEFQFSKHLISKFSLSFFIPLYFAIVGLKIDLPAYFDWKLFISFLLISSALEISSVLIGLRIISKNWLNNLNFGIAMNTRGGPAIVIASMAYEFSIINEQLFVVLVLVAMTTSLISGLWFKLILDRRGFLYA